jgi:hypothetical protein
VNLEFLTNQRWRRAVETHVLASSFDTRTRDPGQEFFSTTAERLIAALLALFPTDTRKYEKKRQHDENDKRMKMTLRRSNETTKRT